jgi:hypothetical protein
LVGHCWVIGHWPYFSRPRIPPTSRWAGTESVRVTLGLPQGVSVQDAAALLSAFEGVSRAEASRQSEARAGSATFTLECSRDLRADLARAVVAKGWDLLTLSRGERELENVFAKLAFGAADASATEEAA